MKTTATDGKKNLRPGFPGYGLQNLSSWELHGGGESFAGIVPLKLAG
jgi:hypothetical protein